MPSSRLKECRVQNVTNSTEVIASRIENAAVEVARDFDGSAGVPCGIVR